MRRPPHARLRAERLEDRTVPATVVVTNTSDDVNGTTTSIANLIANPGTDGISLREAITAANRTAGDDEITFAAGLTSPITLGGTQLPAITGNLTITGPGANLLEISGNDRSRVFLIGSDVEVTISALTVSHGFAFDGAGVSVSIRSKLTVRDAGFADNRATSATGPSAFGSGGAIYFNSQLALGVENCTFVNNAATSDGGAITTFGPTTVVGSAFTGNAVTNSGTGNSSSGGAIVATNTLDVSDTRFTGNSAGSGGAVRYLPTSGTTGRVFTMTACELTGNTARTDGGGVAFTGSFTLTGCTLTENTAPHGGAIRCGSGATLVAAGTAFRRNAATTTGGGAVDNSSGTVRLTDCELDGNEAPFGGGFYSIGTVELTRTVLTNNHATGTGSSNPGGGGAYAGGGSLSVTDCTFSGNTASESHFGGAINGASPLTVSGSTFTGNSAGSGGAISVSSSSPAATKVITNSTFVANTAVKNTITSPFDAALGGAIFSGGSMSLLYCTLTGNSATNTAVGGHGGGGGIAAGDPLLLVNTIIAGNTASSYGPDVSGDVDPSSAFNLIGDGSGINALPTGAGNQIGTTAAPINPLLDSLTNNGGPTPTMALKPGSPARNVGVPAGAGGQPATDQRGAGFVRVGRADIGAP